MTTNVVNLDDKLAAIQKAKEEFLQAMIQVYGIKLVTKVLSYAQEEEKDLDWQGERGEFIN